MPELLRERAVVGKCPLIKSGPDLKRQLQTPICFHPVPLLAPGGLSCLKDDCAGAQRHAEGGSTGSSV